MLSGFYPCKRKRYAYVFMLGFDQGLAYSESVGLTGKMIFSNESNSATAIDNAQQIDSALCKLVGFGRECKDKTRLP